MLEILNTIAPIFGIIFLGFSALAIKLISKEQLKVMGVFVIKIALPCLLLVNVAAQRLDKLWQPQYLFSYGIVSLVLFIGVLLLYRYRWHQPLERSAVMAMGASMSNTGFIGGSILYLLLGASSTSYFAMTFIIENFVGFLMFLICIEMSQQPQHNLSQILLPTLKSIIRNPMIIALSLGIFLSATQLALPSLIKQMLEPIGKTAGVLGLFVVGGSLYGISSIQGIWQDAIRMLLSKMLLMPVLIYGVFLLMPNTNTEMVFAGVLLGGISMATMFTIFGQGFGMGEKTAAILLVCTLANILTVTTVVTLLMPR